MCVCVGGGRVVKYTVHLMSMLHMTEPKCPVIDQKSTIVVDTREDQFRRSTVICQSLLHQPD